MGKKVWVEICLISGRGLRRSSSSLWKLQWYAVGWVHPDHKYCTKIDASGTSNPLWKTGFSTSLELDDPDLDSALHVQVYSRDPFFLRESLFASATVPFKEFLEKYRPDSPVYEVGSFQLRKTNSSKSLGFVDVSIRISQHREEEEHAASSYLGGDEGFNLDNLSGAPALDKGKSHQTENNYQTPSTSRASHQPPPQPLSNVGYIPNFFPVTSSYANTPTVAGRGVGMGLGAGALAAGAVIFGDDHMPSYPPF
ncbi:uncharacterized protein LOC121743396 [Salvia splendens]|uniref:uncharacterized protein LOC121743396 n=1 Tax=Salvia splendens TaxID=180675 RepID=UPI001C271128|nr:uncharacterized protein LOC121743396 [Salvia splendens]